jgi:nucleoside-diphosphate-sugar epimerase
MTRTLITGGFGFIGRYLALMLAEAGHEVTLFDIAADDAFLKMGKGRIAAVRGSLANWAEVMDAVAKVRPEHIIHSGAVLPPASEASPQAAFEVNINGSYYVLEAARLFGVTRVVYASSVASYGPDAPRDVVPNDFAQHPTGMYGVSKVCTERLGEYYHRRFGLDFRAVRFPPIFGLGRAASSGWTAFTSVAVEESALGRPYAMRVSPETATGVLYIRDAAQSLADLAAAEGAALTTRCYSLHGFVVTARELADAIVRHVPNAKISFEPDQQITEFVKSIPQKLDDSLARADWGWRPRYGLDEAVADFVATVRGA